MSKKVIASVLAVALLTTGCQTARHREGVTIGAISGAGLGALIGATTGGSWVWGGLIGAGAGALAGYLIADNTGPREDARAGYSATYGTDDSRRRRDEADREFKIAMAAKDSATSEYHLKRSIEFSPTPAAWNNLGLLQLQSGDKDGARLSFRQAILLDPAYEPALKNLERIGA